MNSDANLFPIYPKPAELTLIFPSLDQQQSRTLTFHCLSRAALFGDIALLSFLLADPHARPHADLNMRDEDGLGLLSLSISGFGLESERDVEREECARLLVSEGADINIGDHAGWTALHHAALFAPPTLVSYLITHGGDVLALTHRSITPFDSIRAHSTIPGREDVALLLDEAMREKGWQGSRLDARRQHDLSRTMRHQRGKALKNGIAKVLNLSDNWWGGNEGTASASFDEDDNVQDSISSDDQQHRAETEVLLPSDSWSSMLVYSPQALSHILQVLITDFTPSLVNADPACTLHLLSRFAGLWGSPQWLEDLLTGAVDRIESVVYSQAEDLPTLTFWMYNCINLLHLLRCDPDISDTLDILGLFALLEELIDAIFVFIIRIAERQVDPFVETSILDYASVASELQDIQFESDWSFFRSLTSRSKSKPATVSASKQSVQSINAALRDPSPTTVASITSQKGAHELTPNLSLPPVSAGTSVPLHSSSPTPFNSLRQSLSTPPPSSTPTKSSFILSGDVKPSGNPHDLISFLSAFHALLVLSGINPVLITQAFSQIMYWTSCEVFNRILSRKKYLCRSRAVQIGRNIGHIETWADNAGLPPGVTSHFSPVYELLHWLQSLSSLEDFPSLVAIIQALRNLNPFQMRRAVKDYRYEIGEDKMSDECAQYLVQLQKDWERHRVKVGVESMRREWQHVGRERGDGSPDPNTPDVQASTPGHERTPSRASALSETDSFMQQSLDRLFDTSREMAEWLPAKPPSVLGELLDSRHMLTLVLPSDPEMLSAIPDVADYLDGPASSRSRDLNDIGLPQLSNGDSKHSNHRPLPYRLLPIRRRGVSIETMALLDDERLKRKPLQSFGEDATRWQDESMEENGEEKDDHGMPKNDDDDDDDDNYILNGVPAQLTTIATRKERKTSGS